MVIAKSYEPPKSFLRHSVWRFSPSLASWFVKVPAPEPRCCRGGVGGDVPWQPDGFFDEFLAMGMIPSGKLTVCYWKWPIEIVDLPSYKMVDLSIVMLNYQRVKACWLAGGFAPCWLPFCKKTSEVCPFFPIHLGLLWGLRVSQSWLTKAQQKAHCNHILKTQFQLSFVPSNRPRSVFEPIKWFSTVMCSFHSQIKKSQNHSLSSTF